VAGDEIGVQFLVPERVKKKLSLVNRDHPH
jgi:hypothetical protein